MTRMLNLSHAPIRMFPNLRGTNMLVLCVFASEFSFTSYIICILSLLVIEPPNMIKSIMISTHLIEALEGYSPQISKLYINKNHKRRV